MSAEDEARAVVRLLWRAHVADETRRGPRQRLTVDDVVDAAVEMADRDGLGSLSVRTVSASLGMKPMSFYTYVPSKDALVALMVDAVAAQDEPFDRGKPLRARLTWIAESVRDELIRHPWLLDASSWRQVTGPHRLRRYERQLEQLVDTGLSDLDSDRVISTLNAFAVGNARETLDAQRTPTESTLTDSQWWNIVGPALSEVMPHHDFPLAGRVGAHVGELFQAPGDPTGAFAFGLDRLLDGIEEFTDHWTHRNPSQRSPDRP
ncbi:MAG: TetR/AcrR family transcriptional regulator C-terminal domain-containing protein [Williamsia sp.]|nr:TetR/AcrR family transcriptional regulator [Williamsia sp.]MBJ7287395.1 TetR/AcrR family transcriptional regulator C-terminal domain-containing protein [Williamsia sp.]